MDRSIHSLSASDFASHDLVVIAWMESLARASELMAEKQVRHLPVVDDQDVIVGILSDRDLNRALHAGSDTTLAEARVRDFMSWPVEAIREDQSIQEAARVMISRKISSLVVTDDQKVVGIITTEDILKAFLGDVTPEQVEEKHGLRDEIEAALYNSPIGPIAHQLAVYGV